MTVYDISGVIRNGIWKYGDSYPDYHSIHTSAERDKCFFEIFDGFKSQSGTYIETAAHINGYSGHRLIADVPTNELYDIPCRILHVTPSNGKITAEHLKKAAEKIEFPDGCAILIDAKHDDWYAPDFLSAAPWLSLDAMEWLLSKNPCLIGSDTPAWQKDEPVFDIFAPKDILLLAPLVGLSNIKGTNAKLTVLPLKIEGTCCAPARAIVAE